MPKKITNLLLIIGLSIVFLLPINEIYAWHTRSTRSKIIKPTSTQQFRITPTTHPTKTPSPTPTLRPTRTPTPTRIPKVITTSPTKSVTLPIQPNGNSKQDFIMGKINEYRKSQGLSEVRTDTQTCNFAKTRAEEISKDFNHSGFRLRIDSKTLPYPGYSSVTENIAMNSDYTKIVEMWINSSGHAENMRKDTPLVCVESFGNYFAYEGLRL